jgi:predicted Rossmann-fold nucleotide-binding protein
VSDYYQRLRKLLTMPVGVLGTLAEFTSAAALSGVGLIRPRVVVLDPDGWFDPIAHFYEKAHRARVSQLPPTKMWTVASEPEEAMQEFLEER